MDRSTGGLRSKAPWPPQECERWSASIPAWNTEASGHRITAWKTVRTTTQGSKWIRFKGMTTKTQSNISLKRNASMPTSKRTLSACSWQLRQGHKLGSLSRVTAKTQLPNHVLPRIFPRREVVKPQPSAWNAEQCSPVQPRAEESQE